MTTNTLQVGKVKLQLSNLDKVFLAGGRHTRKGDVIMYYNNMYPHIIPYLRNRPQSMRRTPNGIADNGFFQKDVGNAVPDWAKTVSLYSESTDKDIEYLLCNDRATLLYMANLGCIELNPWNSTVKNTWTIRIIPSSTSILLIKTRLKRW